MSATGVNMSLEEATKIAEEVVFDLKPFCKRIEATGTVRRKDQETTHDIDIVLIRDESKFETFAKIIDSLEYVKGKPDGKWCCRRMDSGVMLDIRMCTEADWGWRLIQHTGPTDFYLWARAELEGNEKNFSTEEEVFKALGMDYITPEDRHKIEVDMSKIENKDVSLFGIVGFEDNTLKNIIEQIENEDELNLRINSPGGDAVEGLGIFDFIVAADMPVSVEIFGEAASAAAIISQGADKGKRRMAKNATFMIHNPFTFSGGEAEDFEKKAEELRNFENRMVKLFAESTGQTQKKIRDLMDDGGTSMDSKKALELGFIDEIIGAQNMAPIIWNMADLPEKIVRQLPVLKKTPPNKSFRWQDADANTQQLPTGNELFDLRINGRTFIITKEKFLMLQQFVNLSGKRGPDEALAFFTELKENKPQDPSNAGILALESTVNILKADLVVKSSLLKGVVEKQDKQELEERRDRIDACLTTFRIDVSQKDLAIKAYVDIEPETVLDSQPLFDAAMIYMESSKPREDLKGLVKLAGSGGEGKPGFVADDKLGGSAIEQEVSALINSVKADKKIKLVEAEAIVKADNPELYEKYEASIAG